MSLLTVPGGDAAESLHGHWVCGQRGIESIQITVDTYGDVDRTTSKVAATVMDQLLAE